MTQLPVQPSPEGTQRTKHIRIVIGEDTFLMREALERIVSGFDYVEAVAFCADRDSLTAAIARERPDAVLTDIRMPPTGTDEGIQVARELRVSDPDIGVDDRSLIDDRSRRQRFPVEQTR